MNKQLLFSFVLVIVGNVFAADIENTSAATVVLLDQKDGAATKKWSNDKPSKSAFKRRTSKNDYRDKHDKKLDGTHWEDTAKREAE
jgi:hypothetical protein